MSVVVTRMQDLACEFSKKISGVILAVAPLVVRTKNHG